MLFVLFQLGSDRYALPASDVAEVLPMMSVKALPGAPVGVAGLIDYHGRAVPAIDLSLLALGRAAERLASTRFLIVTYQLAPGDERLLCLIAERATEMMTREPEEFRPANVAVDATRYLGPVAHDAHGLIQRVEVRALLTAEVCAALFPEPAATAT